MACPSGGVQTRGAVSTQGSRFSGTGGAAFVPIISLTPQQQLASLPPAQRAMMLQQIQQRQAAQPQAPAPALAPTAALAAAQASQQTPKLEPPSVVPAVALPVAPAIAPEEAERKLVEALRVRAEDGQAAAQFSLALRYLKGRGVEKDAEQAQTWLRAAAALGYDPAIRRLAEFTPAPTPTESPAK